MNKAIIHSAILVECLILSAFGLSGKSTGYPDEMQQRAVGPSKHVYLVETGGILQSPADSDGYKIPDFSYAGYMNSNCPLPVSGKHYQTVVKLINPSGDETVRIQKAINSVAELPLNKYGYRGAVELGEGVWNITELIIDADGIVLRGRGIESTVLQNIDTKAAKQVIRIGPEIPSSFPTELWDDGKDGSLWNITDEVVYAGDRSFNISPGHTLEVGDRIIIEHPCTDKWLSAIGGGAPAPKQWPVGSVPIRYYRYVTDVDGNTIQIDAPVMYSLVKSLAQCMVFRYSIITRKQIGVEDLSIDADISSDTFNENHAKTCIQAQRVENCWFRNVHTRNFYSSGFYLIESSRITVTDCEAIDPHSKITSARRYNFQTRGGQLVLFKNCFASKGRHCFVGGGHGMDSGNVFLNCIAENNYAATEDGHQRWVNGTLFDNCAFRQTTVPEDGNEFDPKMLWLGNHGVNSNGHGWASCTTVAYKCTVEAPGYAIVAKPPTGMNYEIECRGDFRSDHFAHGDYPGALDIVTKGSLPESLFEAQLKQRLNKIRNQ
ncbi:MAG: right-handed parallel beta-helix repeat-containing protein [Prolixibacteraceae bacterium]|jgi:hypothetical protein|nr:right-handed parallel beta-helix repeat-containing protein [Prolixibacteraceae bacterium]